VLLVVYVGLSFLNNTHGYLGTDTGGKVATLRAMSRHGGLNPDVGYWAARWDPTGRLHPLYYTARIHGKWINVTTLPALYLAYPLWRLGGYRAALLIPMLGSVAAALAARALALRLGAGRGAGRDSGGAGGAGVAMAAFWVVGLASPLTIYALDFWEHSVGVALMAWAIVILLGTVNSNRASPGTSPFWKSSVPVSGTQLFQKLAPAGLGAGVLFGLSATIRTESLVYGGVAVGIVCLVLLWRGCRHARLRLSRALAAPIAVGVAAAVGLAIPLLLNSALEKATIGGTLRSERTAGTAAAVGSVAGSRVQEAALTTLGMQTDLRVKTYFTGAALVVLVLVAVALARDPRPERRRFAMVAGAGAVVLYVLRFATGLGFVPGLFAAAPVAIVGLLGLWRGARARIVTVIALGSLPIVWLFQYLGGAGPQWGGRYILTTGLLLTTVGVVVLARAPRTAAATVLAVAVGVTTFGLVWVSVRTHQVAHTEAALARRPEPVLVSAVAHLAREGGAYAGVVRDHRWLTLGDPSQLPDAAGIVRAAGFTTFALVQEHGQGRAPAVAGWTMTGTDRLSLFESGELVVTTYRFNPQS
jgi:hypothetical protein